MSNSFLVTLRQTLTFLTVQVSHFVDSYFLLVPQVPISSTLAVANGLSWHAKLPIIAVAGNNRIHFWGVET